MLDKSLWSPFHQAKDALLAKLISHSSPVHVLSAPPSQRPAIRGETHKLISSLLELERDVEAIQQELALVHESASRRRVAAEMSLRPIGVLPSDVMREIVSYTVEGPHARRQILDLSHISGLWREVVSGMSALFTEADWDHWPGELVDLWCSRAGSHLLKVSLEHSLRGTQGGPRNYPLRVLLRKLSMQVGELKVTATPYHTQTVNRAAFGVFSMRMPLLKHMKVSITNEVESEFHIQPGHVPGLRGLELATLRPRMEGPLPSVTHLLYHIPAYIPWLHQSRILSNLPNLLHLTLVLNEIYSSASPHVVLPSLISLEVQCGQLNMGGVLRFFATLSLPNLQSLMLHLPSEHSGEGALFPILGQEMPDLKSFHFSGPAWPIILPSLSPTNSTPMIFPELQEAVFLAPPHDKLRYTDEHYNTLYHLILAREGILTRLSIPAIRNMEILDPLKNHITRLEVSEPIDDPSGLFFHSIFKDELMTSMR